jgi:hypothetical protein
MTLRMALRSFAAQPVRSAVLACGFGTGIACMAGLLGVGEVILEQSRSPHLRGGGDLVVYGAAGRVSSARFVSSQLFASPPLTGRAAVASPSLDATLYLLRDGSGPLALDARGGIPDLERALGDPEISAIAAWTNTPADDAWAEPDPADVLRAMDRFHAIPPVAARADSWAEWLYFNGRTRDVRFYLSFMVGPRTAEGRRRAGVRLQLERNGRMASYVDTDEIPEHVLLAEAPDIRIGASRVRLDGLRYRIALGLYADEQDVVSAGPEVADLTGEIILEAVAGRSLPPFEVGSVGGWVSGYVVPVLSGALDGWLRVGEEEIPLDGGVGYHDHNWGFWEGVTWQWGQVTGDDVSLLYGRIRPPVDVADPDRIPGFLVALGPDGPLGFATDVSIEEFDDPVNGRPRQVVVQGHGDSLNVRLKLTVLGITGTRLGGSFGGEGEFIQLQARYEVRGSLAGRKIEFTAPGAAETFRGPSVKRPR